MEENIIRKIVRALPDEGVKELDQILDGDFEEAQIAELLKKYNINLQDVLKLEEA